MIKGKQGRFRENLLGKRVDYSARSVIVVGPELRLHQCGLPKTIALELFQPFIIRRLRELGLADTIKSAKKMLERRDEEVWDILEEVISDHPVLLNRAPTLHRMGIQAFEPVLIEGNAIKIHPLVCSGFNADFDGDQMAVHLPLSYEAQIEASTLMLATNNVFSPANGNPDHFALAGHRARDLLLVFRPRPAVRLGEDEVRDLGRAILGILRGEDRHPRQGAREAPAGTRVRVDRAGREVTVNDHGNVPSPDPNKRVGEPLVTTAGRAILNEILPKEMAYYNYELDKKGIQGLISDCHQLLGRKSTIRFLDDLKEIGFKWATRAGLSFSKDDMRIPGKKNEIIAAAEGEANKVRNQYVKGVITDNERYNKIVDIWTRGARAHGPHAHRRAEAGHPQRPALSQSHLLYGAVGRPRLGRPDSPTIRHARIDGEAQRQDHRDADQGQLPRGVARSGVLLVDARRPKGSRRHGAEDGRRRLPHAQARRRGAKRGRDRRRLHDTQWQHQGCRRIAAKRWRSRSRRRSAVARRSARSSIRSPKR